MFSLHFSGFQNGSFYTSKRLFLPCKMSLFGKQNGSYWKVKWLILKIEMKDFALLFNFFTVSRPFVSLKWSFFRAQFFGYKCLQSDPIAHWLRVYINVYFTQDKVISRRRRSFCLQVWKKNHIFGFAEGTRTRKCKRKTCFLFAFLSFFRTFASY